MAEFTAKDVQEVRQATGAGMLDSKKALEETNGDKEAAKQLLREKGLAASAKRSDRDNTQGAVALTISSDGAAMVELVRIDSSPSPSGSTRSRTISRRQCCPVALMPRVSGRATSTS
jgi:hypothetical protein